MRAYLSIFRMRKNIELQYRGAVIGGIICQIFFGLILVALYRALYAGKPQTLPLSHVVSYVWLQQAFFRMLLASDPELLDKIRTGGIAYDLCRPLHLYGYYYARTLAQKMTGSLLRAVPMLAFAFLLPEGWGLALPTTAAGFAWCLGAMAPGLLCSAAMENIAMGFTMRTKDPRGVKAMMELLMMSLCGNILPLTLFPDSWQRVITALPYAQMLDAPIRLYTGEYAPAQGAGVLLLQAAWTAALVCLGVWIWNRNRRHIVLQGG